MASYFSSKIYASNENVYKFVSVQSSNIYCLCNIHDVAANINLYTTCIAFEFEQIIITSFVVYLWHQHSYPNLYITINVKIIDIVELFSTYVENLWIFSMVFYKWWEYLFKLFYKWWVKKNINQNYLNLLQHEYQKDINDVTTNN